tara:strand:+ start:3719 stop:4249 length:531 start_codon:yes stop_codon:yes gene_type:complete
MGSEFKINQIIMKTLKQIQEENRKFIIMACNPGAKTYEEALEMELGFGCGVVNKFRPTNKHDEEIIWKVTREYWNGVLRTNSDEFPAFEGHEIKDYKIIGKPLTLNRVLTMLNRNFNQVIIGIYKNDNEAVMTICNSDSETCVIEDSINWDLTKETLEEQLEETQRAINELNNPLT